MKSNRLNFSFRRLLTAGAVSAMLTLTGGPVSAVPLIWDNSDNDQIWLNANNWDGSIIPLTTSDVELPKPIPGASGILTLGAGSVANSLSFFAPYTLTGGDLALTTGGVRVTIGNTSTIASQLTGAGGLLKTGDGALILSNALNNYTGTTEIASGSVIVTDQGALGGDGSAVVVSGNAQRAVGGGNLTINGGSAGLTWTRALALTGGGPTGDGNALNSVGSNVFQEAITTGSHIAGQNPVSGVPFTTSVTRLASTYGTSVIDGPLTLGGGAGILTQFSGNGNWIINSNVTGEGGLEKAGSGLLILTGANDYSGITQISGGFLRISDVGQLGSNVGATAVNLNGGTLEMRSDTGAGFSSKRVTLTNTATVFVDHAVDTLGLNQNINFGILGLVANRTMTVNGRNGTSLTFTGNQVAASLANNNTFTINANGLFTIAGNAWNNTNTTARTLTIGGAGDTLITGSVLASGANHILTKSGTGTLTINGAGSTYLGATNINGGTVVVRDFRSLNNNSEVINIGTGGTAGTLSIGTSTAPTAAGLTTSKVINLAGTTGTATINANQSITSPVILNADFTAAGTASQHKTLILGGTNTTDNIVNGIIPNNSNGGEVSLVKTGAGTWVLTGANTYSGATLINGGLLKVQDTFLGGSRNVISDSNPVGFSIGLATLGSAGGALEYIGAAGQASAETMGTLLPGGGAGTINVTAGVGGSANLTFASVDQAASVTTTAAIGGTATTTMTVASTAGLVPGMKVIGGTGAATTIVSITNGTTFVVSANQTNVPSGTVLQFVRANGGATLNFNPDANSNVILGSANAVGLLNSYSYFKGADFAYAPAMTNATLRAPVYDTDAGFVTAGAALSGTNHNLVAGDTSTGAVTLSSLKIDGTTSPVVTQTGLLTIREGAAGTSGGILATGGSSTINGTGVTTGGAADLIIRVDGSGDVLNLNAPVTATTTGGLTKTGAGTLIIGGLNAQTTGGSTNLLEGTIQLTTGGRLSANSVNMVMRQGTFFDLNGISTAQSATSSSIGAFNGDGTVTNTSATPVLFAVGGGTTGGSGTFNGTINETSGQISVVKMGTTNSQTWTGVSNYTGSTTIGVPGTGTTGSLTVTNLANIGEDSGIGRGDATSTATNQGSLIFGGTTGGLIYTGANSVSTDRLFTLAGTATGSGATITANGLNGATLQFSNLNPIAFGSGTGAQLLRLNGTSTGDNLFNPQLIDNGANALSLQKVAAGLWILGNTANSYTGTTQIDAGALRATLGSSLPDASPVVFNGGVLQSSGTFTRSLTTTPTAGAGGVSWLAATGGGFAASTEKLTVNIGGSVTPDTLTWGSGGFVGTGGALILSSDTSLAEVDVLNNIDLAGATRTITVNTNSTTNSDFATLTGVISGGAGSGLIKGGSGILRLLSENTYEGTTNINAGTVRVLTLGNTGGASSSLGAGGTITIGSGTATTGTLAYVGTGETSNRLIQLGGTTASAIIESSGSGPLILSNVQNTGSAGARTLFLRGDLNAANEITSDLANNGGNLAITKDDNGTWILSGANTYSGATTVSQGALGFRTDTVGGPGSVTSGPVGTGLLISSNGMFFALDGDRVIDNDFRLNGNATSNFIGINSMTFNGALTTTTAGNTTVTNSLPQGALLTFNSPTFTGTETATARTLVFNGSGDTVLNASVTDSTGGAVINLNYQGYGSLTLGGSNGASTYSGTTTIVSGTVKLGVADAIPSGVGKGNLTISPGTGLTATLDVNGFDQTVNGITATTAGISTLDNSSATAATLSVGGNDQDVTFIGGTANTGAGALSITKVGTGTATFSQGPFEHEGATTVTGGVLSLAADVNGTTALNVSGAGSLLRLTGGLSGASLVDSISVGDGSTLSLLDGAGSAFGLDSLTLGTAAGTLTTLKLNVGDLNTPAPGPGFGDGLNTDSFTLLTGGVLNLYAGNQIRLEVTDTGLNALKQYVLFDATAIGGGLLDPLKLNISDYILAPIGGFDSFDLTTNSTNNQIILTMGNLITGDLYWNANGTVDNWNDVNNWSPDLNGVAVAASTPGQGSNVIFKADNITGTDAVVTTLEQNFKVNRLNFIPATNPANTPTSVSIDPGADLLARLEIAPQNSVDGINIGADGPANVSISTLLKLGANQTWTVADSSSTLTVSGALQGEAALVKAGAGKVIVSSAAAPSFNPGATGTVTINGGAFEIQNVGSLGTTAIGNAAAVQVNSGGSFYYNGAAGTVTNAITLNGGSLGVGGANQTYSGAIGVNGTGSILQGFDALVPATARNLTLTNSLTGSGSLMFQGLSTSTSGGTVLKADSSATFSGNMIHDGGSVYVDNAGALGTGSYTADNTSANTGSRLLFRPANGVTFDINNAISVTDGSISEIQVDNISSTALVDAIANVVNPLELGASSILRLYLADVFSEMNLDGGIQLAGNASITTGGGTGVLVGNTITVAGISETGGSRALTINDGIGNTGTWSGNKVPTLAITAASSYTGGTTISGGTVRLDVKNALSSGAVTIAAASTLQAGADLSGTNAVANDVTLNNTLTVSGTNHLTLSGTFVTNGANANRSLVNNLGGGAVLTLSGGVALAPAAGNTAARTFIIDGSGDTLISGAMVNGNAFANVINKNGTGTLTLSNTGNAYTGGTVVNNGTLRTSASNVIPNTGTVTVRSNSAGNPVAIFDLDGNNETIAALTFGGTGGLATSQNSVTTGAGVLTLGGNVTVTSTGNFTTAPVFTGTLGLGGGSRTFTINDSTGSDVDLDITGGVITNGGATARGVIKAGAGTMDVGSAENSYTGSTTINAGVYRVSAISDGGVASTLGASSNAAANLVLGGGTLQFTGTSASTDRSFTLTTATTSTVDVSLLGTKLTLAGGSAATDGALTKVGAGTLEVTGVNLHTGLTTVSEGTLLVNNTTGAGLSGDVTVGTGATLGGAGTILGAVTVNGTVAAGNSVDMLTVGSFVLGSGGNAVFELSGATTNDFAGVNAYLANPGAFVVPSTWTDYQDGLTLHDHIRITGGAPTFDSNGTITLSELNYTPVFGDVFQIFDWSGLGTASATGTPMFILPTSVSWNTDLFQSHGLAFVVPEPGRAMLLFFGLFGLVMRRRRR